VVCSGSREDRGELSVSRLVGRNSRGLFTEKGKIGWIFAAIKEVSQQSGKKVGAVAVPVPWEKKGEKILDRRRTLELKHPHCSRA